MISTREYVEKYGVTRETVRKWASEGRIAALMEGFGWSVEDCLPPDYPHHPPPGPNLKRCGSCWLWKSRRDDFSPSRQSGARGICKDCMSHHERKRRLGVDDLQVKVGEQELRVLHELARMGEAGIERREAAKARHAARIENLGLCGDGRDWPHA